MKDVLNCTPALDKNRDSEVFFLATLFPIFARFTRPYTLIQSIFLSIV